MSAYRRFTAAASFALMLAASTQASAKMHRATECSFRASDLSSHGQPLSYDAIAKARGVTRVASTGTVYAQVTLPNGRVALYAVEPSGCARRAHQPIGALR